MYPDVHPKEKWVKEVLVAWNPLAIRKNGKFGLSDLGRDLVALPGKEGAKPTPSERGFLLSVMMLDPYQGNYVHKLLCRSSRNVKDNKWTFNQT